MLSGPVMSPPSSVVTRTFSKPGIPTDWAALSGRSTRFLKSVTAVRKLLVRREVSTVSRPPATWLVVFALTLPLDGRRFPPKLPRLELSSRLQRTKTSLFDDTRQSPRSVVDSKSNGGAFDVNVGKYGVLMPIADFSLVFSIFPNQNTRSLSAGPPALAPYCSRSKSGALAAER